MSLLTHPELDPTTSERTTAFRSPGPFDPEHGHEQVVYCHDRASGLRAIIAIHSTALGPALGGTRFYPYPTEDDALADVLRLSRGMTYKCALAGLDHGGGKAVIIGDPARDKSEALLRAYGRFVESLGGRYVTACDVGTYVADMDVIHRETGHVVGRSEVHGGSGDSSVLTAFGVFTAMRACAAHVWGSDALRGRTVGVAGVGKVGHLLVGHLVDAGAQVVVTDVSTRAVERVRAEHPAVDVVAGTDALVRSTLDVYAPCALGGALDRATVDALSAKIVCGAANNQLADDGAGHLAERLLERGITYAPDYLVNAGGVIQVSDEEEGFDMERARHRVEGLFATTEAVLARAAEQGISPARAADHLAEERIAAIGARFPYLRR
ncbi:Glu/Leu/Phe/Val dehydrogenase dimerization domain-containing protein [Georgenia thermotolerans]|uniref:Glu/Leu/Phe/Val dehydrogenase dimerization domain-containing protein n=1 Tax=Georgenia thermotolerans TaxID=527326 RepID=UPI0024AFD0B7|nr:Glu/Leu/Phe/Val dehydrogenase dimerization domain-containing protein [Georgenia thermotolerans]